MPRYLRNVTELSKIRGYFEILATVPYLEPDDPASQDDCAICKEPFEWQPLPGETLNKPVRLYCGHVFGIQCLAEWVFSPTFFDCCPFCRARIPDPNGPILRHPKLDIIHAELDLLCVFQDQISRRRKAMLQSRFAKSIKRVSSQGSLPAAAHKALKDHRRLRMLWRVLLDTMCDDPSEPETQPMHGVRAQPENQRIQIAENEAAFPRFLARLAAFNFLTQREHQVGLLFFFGGVLATIDFVILWNHPYGGTHEACLRYLANYKMAVWFFIFGIFVRHGLLEPFLVLLNWMIGSLWLNCFIAVILDWIQGFQDA